MLNNLTMVLCTYGRAYMLADIINYHAPLGMELFILDSSEKAYDLGELKDKFPNVYYYHMPNTTSQQRYNFILDKIQTPYFVFRADRRHHSNHFLNTAIEFLDANPDYISAAGVWLADYNSYKKKAIKSFRDAYVQLKVCVKNILKLVLGRKLINNTRHPLQPLYFLGLFDTSSEIDDTMSRVKCTATTSTPRYYNVMRSELAKKIIPLLFDLDQEVKNAYYQEFIVDFTFLISGKTKKLPCLAGVVHWIAKVDTSYADGYNKVYGLYLDPETMHSALKHIIKHCQSEELSADFLKSCFEEYSKRMPPKWEISYGLSMPCVDSNKTLELLKNMYAQLNFGQSVDQGQMEFYLRALAACHLYENLKVEHIQSIFSDEDRAEQTYLEQMIQIIDHKNPY